MFLTLPHRLHFTDTEVAACQKQSRGSTLTLEPVLFLLATALSFNSGPISKNAAPISNSSKIENTGIQDEVQVQK